MRSLSAPMVSSSRSTVTNATDDTLTSSELQYLRSTHDLRPPRLAVIVGSTREGRFAPTVANWFVDQARTRADIDIDVIDLADARPAAVYPASARDAVDAYAERIDRADGFVVVTPEYNHGYPASLKQAIDLAHHEWRAKPVAFVSYGGMAGGLRAVEQLRQVFAELHATTVRDTRQLPPGPRRLRSRPAGSRRHRARGRRQDDARPARLVGRRPAQRARTTQPYAA